MFQTEVLVQKDRGVSVLQEIESRFASLLLKETEVSSERIRIGLLLQEVKENEYWRESYKSMDAYICSLKDRYHHSRTQCYAYLGICTDLLPELGAEKLSNMGLGKAILLRRAKSMTGSLPAPEIIEMAADSKVHIDDFKQRLLEEKKIPEDLPKAKCYSLDYFADEDRRATISAAFASAIRTGEIKTRSEEERNGAVLEVLSQEYLGANSEGL